MTFSPAIWGFGYIQTSIQVASGVGFFATPSVNSRGGFAHLGGVDCNVNGGVETFLGTVTTFGTFKPQTQGSTGYPMFPMAIGSSTATMQGPVGDLIDWWTQATTGVYPGDWLGNQDWILLGNGTHLSTGSAIAWPWDGSTYPQVA